MIQPSTAAAYEIAIIGAGIAGSSLATVLARHGLTVIVFEAKSHPKFSIGESMILETSETMRALSELYDVPELAYFSSENFISHIGTSHGIKRHFSYLHHTKNKPHELHHTLQAVIPKEPHGHELHLYRQDVDAFMTTCAVQYGATVLQNMPVADIVISEDGVQIETSNGQTFVADYIVDASGFNSLLARKFDLREFDLQTHSRAIFTHMVGVPDFHATGASLERYGLPFSVAEGTLHHIFDGGWLWIIPFDNHAKSTNPLCSVGLMLDPRVFPLNETLSADEEFWEFVERFPDIKAQLANAKAVRSWTRTGRIQYSSKRVVGDRFALLGHAAGFIDPLYSKGLYSSLASVSVLADLLLQAHGDGDYSTGRFLPLEKMTLAYIKTADRLIANSYKSWRNFKLWTVYSVLWLLGAYTELVKLNSIRLQATDRPSYYKEAINLKLAGGGYVEYEQIADKIDTLFEKVNPDDEDDVDRTVAEANEIFANISWMPLPFQALLKGATFLPKNKIRLDLFNKEYGFMRTGAYRQHFFGHYGMKDVIRAFVQEKWKYSVRSLNAQRQKRRLARR